MKKSLKDISWKCEESEYRKDKALSYSTLAKYERSGFNQLDSLFDKVESPSLTFGSCVDSIITGSMEEFNDRFLVAEYPDCPDAIIKIVKQLFNMYKEEHNSLNDIENGTIIKLTEIEGFQRNWKPDTRAKVIKERGSEYYNLLYLAENKTIISSKEYQDVMNAVTALKDSKSTRWYFQADTPFEDIERLYQLKFKAKYNNIDYRCMADLIIVDHEKKLIIPCDLKTSSHTEWDFYQSFKDWRYDIQARLYWYIIRTNMDNDEYFKDFALADYRFIVVNKRTLVPLVWKCPFTSFDGELIFGKNNQIVFRSPFTIGEELSYYLSSRPKVPQGIKLNEENNIEEWLNKL